MRMARNHATPKANRLAIVRAYRKSGMTKAQFASANGIGLRTLGSWITEFPASKSAPFLLLSTLDKTIASLTALKQSILSEGHDLVRPSGSKESTRPEYQAFFNIGVDPNIDQKMKEWALKNRTTVAKAYEFAAAKLLKLI